MVKLVFCFSEGNGFLINVKCCVFLQRNILPFIKCECDSAKDSIWNIVDKEKMLSPNWKHKAQDKIWLKNRNLVREGKKRLWWKKNLPTFFLFQQCFEKKFISQGYLTLYQTTTFQGRVENIVGKGENAGYQHFLLLPLCFHKASYTGWLKVVTVW